MALIAQWNRYGILCHNLSFLPAGGIGHCLLQSKIQAISPLPCESALTPACGHYPQE